MRKNKFTDLFWTFKLMWMSLYLLLIEKSRHTSLQTYSYGTWLTWVQRVQKPYDGCDTQMWTTSRLKRVFTCIDSIKALESLATLFVGNIVTMTDFSQEPSSFISSLTSILQCHTSYTSNTVLCFDSFLWLHNFYTKSVVSSHILAIRTSLCTLLTYK